MKSGPPAGTNALRAGTSSSTQSARWASATSAPVPLLVTPPALIEPAFGPASRELHGAAARAAGATLVELEGPLALDVDTAADLVDAEALGAIRG